MDDSVGDAKVRTLATQSWPLPPLGQTSLPKAAKAADLKSEGGFGAARKGGMV